MGHVVDKYFGAVVGLVHQTSGVRINWAQKNERETLVRGLLKMFWCVTRANGRSVFSHLQMGAALGCVYFHIPHRRKRTDV